MSRGALQDAIGYAARAAAISPLDENHQALLIRLYRTAGDDEAAEKQYAACTAAFAAELGAAPGPVVQAALRETREVREEVADRTTIEAVIEAGSAAVSAGATEAGVHSLRTAAKLADRHGGTRLRVGARLVLAEALIHASSLMVEAKAAYVQDHGLPPIDWLLSRVERWSKLASRFPILSNALMASRGARYVGLIGSRRKIKMIFENLAAEGVSREALSKVHAPLGIDIGSQTVPEIAVSICAELVAHRNLGQVPGRPNGVEI